MKPSHRYTAFLRLANFQKIASTRRCGFAHLDRSNANESIGSASRQWTGNDSSQKTLRIGESPLWRQYRRQPAHHFVRLQVVFGVESRSIEQRVDGGDQSFELRSVAGTESN